MDPKRKALSLISSTEAEFTVCVLPEDKVRIILLEDVKGEPLSIMM